MKIALIGYGKMGKEIEKIALSRGHQIVSIIDLNNQDDFTSEAFKSADVAIEFTAPTVAYNNYINAFNAGVKVVGVSGSNRMDGDENSGGRNKKIYAKNGGKTRFSGHQTLALGVAIFSASK